MALTKEAREILKLSANKLREQQQKIEELEKKAKREELVSNIMGTLRNEGLISSYSEEEKEAKLKDMSIDKLETTKEALVNFVKQAEIKIGDVADPSGEGALDPIESWLVDGT